MSNNTLSHSFITSTDDLGGMEYPFLQYFSQWVIRTQPIAEEVITEDLITLRWVKDNKICDLFIPGIDTQKFLEITGLALSMHKGPFVLSKRISRLMRPYRYWLESSIRTVNIEFADVDGALWDGCARISRNFLLKQMAGIIENTSENQPYLKELKTCSRWELTVLHDGGQEKGHAIVMDDQEADIIVPTGATKIEISYSQPYNIFVGLNPVHSDDQMRLDIQSLINLYPFFQPDKILEWMQMESDLFLHRIRTNQLDAIIGRLYNLHSAEQMKQLRQWVIGDYLASGGQLMWFPGAVRAMTRQFLRRIEFNQEKFRYPIAGGRYYIFPAAIGKRDVKPGEIELDPRTATAWVADEDWLSYIVEVLGGCDGDDALWIFQFTDRDDEKKVLAWRSPNQLGEYVVLRPSANSHEIRWETAVEPVTWPQMDSSQLPPRIDKCQYEYGELKPFPQAQAEQYNIKAMAPAIETAWKNKSVLGAYCNALMVIKATYGKLSTQLPARLEDVIDGSVKSPMDLSPVMEWIEMVGERIGKQRKPVSDCLRHRLGGARLQPGRDHWLDELHAATRIHAEQFQVDAQALEMETTPPLAIFQGEDSWQTLGRNLLSLYQKTLKETGDFEKTQAVCLKSQFHIEPGTLLGAAAYAYQNDLSDAVLWMLDFEDGTPGFARYWLDALRTIGLIGEPVWTAVGPALVYDEPVPVGVPLRINGVWFNIRDARYVAEKMSDLTLSERNELKQKCTQADLTDLVLYTSFTDNGRVITRTHDGKLFGYVQKGQESRVLLKGRWVVRKTAVRDGNVYAVVT